MDIYFPSCNFTKASPEAAKRLRRWMQARMPVAGCCRTDKTPRAADDTALYFCQACREVLEGRMQTRSLWEYLDGDADFPLPDYSGLRVNLQDCWRDHAHPEIHEAVRSLLHKMHVEVVELDRNREKADFCGNLHAEPKAPALRRRLRRRAISRSGKCPPPSRRRSCANRLKKSPSVSPSPTATAARRGCGPAAPKPYTCSSF